MGVGGYFHLNVTHAGHYNANEVALTICSVVRMKWVSDVAIILMERSIHGD